ncbi:MAG: hypothetical protein ACFB0A_14580 [Croceivirga sp.]
MKNKIKWIAVTIISVVSVFLLFVFIEDQTFEPIKFDNSQPENRKSLFLTWEAEDDTLFWADYEKQIYPKVKELHQRQLITAVFPFEHKSLGYINHDLKWTHCVVLMLHDTEKVSEISSTLLSLIEASDLKGNFRALDLMTLQKGLDMFYPLKNGRSKATKMNQTIEYVFSNPESRSTYYHDQYIFSGPAMKDLYSRDKAGRFIGFELEQRIHSKENMPEWDLIHIIGFTSWQEIKAIPFYYRIWNKHAERAFGEGMTFDKKVAEWNNIRTNVKSSTKQNFTLTLRR